MKFAEIEHLIEDGDLVLSRGSSFRSWFIRQRTQSRFSHCGFAAWIVHAGQPRLCVLEATEGRGVQLMPLSRLLERDGTFDWWKLQDEIERPHFQMRIKRNRVIGFALDQLGQRYASPWQFVRSFSIGTRRVLDWLGFETDTDRSRFFCSELVMSALEEGGFRASRHCEPAEMSPGDVAELTCFCRKGTVTL